MKLYLLLTGIWWSCMCYGQLNKQAVYLALSGNSETTIRQELSKLDKAAKGDETNAYKGALMMKLSAYMKTPKEKLNQFKEGKELLETSIQNHTSNVEYRFLRLLIQENAPKQLKYHAKLEEDAEMIRNGYSKLNVVTKNAIRDYAKQSAYLSGI